MEKETISLPHDLIAPSGWSFFRPYCRIDPRSREEITRAQPPITASPGYSIVANGFRARREQEEVGRRTRSGWHSRDGAMNSAPQVPTSGIRISPRMHWRIAKGVVPRLQLRRLRIPRESSCCKLAKRRSHWGLRCAIPAWRLECCAGCVVMDDIGTIYSQIPKRKPRAPALRESRLDRRSNIAILVIPSLAFRLWSLHLCASACPHEDAALILTEHFGKRCSASPSCHGSLVEFKARLPAGNAVRYGSR